MAPPAFIEPYLALVMRIFPRERFSHFNVMLVCFMLYMAMCAFNFGYDVGTFGGIQGLQSFTSQFGEYQPDTKLYALPGWLSSVMTATPFLGKAAGCIACGLIIERAGRKRALIVLSILSLIGVTLQVTATTAAQFTIGRIFTFAMTGMTIVVVPIYQAETAPRVLRGMFGSMIQAMIVFGQLVATLVTYGTQDIPDSKGWRIPVSIQFIMPIALLVCLRFIPESPRWLLMRRRRSEAFRSLQRFRPKSNEEEVQYELLAIERAIQNEDQGSWAEVFDKKNGMRTMAAVLAMFGQQITGQAFPSQYGVIFYQAEGFGSQAFTLNVLSSAMALLAVLFVSFYVDSIGRRKILLVGGTFMGVWLYVLGAVGSIKPADLTVGTRCLMVAAILLFVFFYNASWAPVSYVVVSEVASQRVREKTNLLACVVSVITTFGTSFTVPYLVGKDYANLGGKVGFIYGSFCFAMVVVTWFVIPELKGRTLEEVDQLFESGVPLRKFGSVATKTTEGQYMHNLQVLESRSYDPAGEAIPEYRATDDKQASAP